MKKSIKQKAVASLAIFSLSTAAPGSVVVFANTGTSKKTTSSTVTASVTLAQAQEKALKEAKGGKVIGYEQEEKHGKAVYEVTILDGKNEKEYKIDGQSGAILKSKTKDLSQDREDQQLIGASVQLDLAKVESQLKSKYSNASIEKVELDVEDGKLVYSVSLREGNQKIELELDANTGTVLEEDVELDHD